MPPLSRKPLGDRPWADPGTAVGDRVDALLTVMTLEEKLAQLGSVWPAEVVLLDHEAVNG